MSKSAVLAGAPCWHELHKSLQETKAKTTGSLVASSRALTSAAVASRLYRRHGGSGTGAYTCLIPTSRRRRR